MRILIVDDSIVAQKLLNYIYSRDTNIQVVGIANNGVQALELTLANKPDVISMDIHMPEMNGFETTRRIMETCPTPIVIVSGNQDTSEVSVAFKIIEAGALTAVNRPPAPNHPDFERIAGNLQTTIKLMSEIKVVKRSPKKEQPTPRPTRELLLSPPLVNTSQRVKLVAIGASTGGPNVLKSILAGIPKDFCAPILIVQHIADGFISGLADWLTSTTGYKVKVGVEGESIKPGIAYLPPDGLNMSISPNGQNLQFTPYPKDAITSSVSLLFESVLSVFGKTAIGVLLTGMGSDGAKEFALLKKCGATTIAQDKETCIVFGMPGEAIKLGGASMVLPADKIAENIMALSRGWAITNKPQSYENMVL